ncbi:MAG: hypothetical protein LBI14_09065 [Treponema sp.]|jgi:hypothetical protein|nr:hypothetical protein [Treponema sp.]
MKRIKFILLGLVVISVILSIVSCLDPLTFNPDFKLNIKAEITGQIDAWLKDNSVLWVINKSKTVDIRELKITRDDNDEVYPIIYPPGDIYGSGAAIPHGTSLASYHRPAPHNPVPWYTVEITYSTAGMTFPQDKPDWWDSSYAIDYGVYPPQGPDHTIKVKKQMPRGLDYVLLFYKTSEGQLMVVDQDTEKHAPNPTDTIENGQVGLPPNNNQVIVSGLINAIINNEITVTGLDSRLEGIINEIRNAGQNAILSTGDLSAVINNAFDRHAQTLLDAFLNHKIEVQNTVNVDTGMQTLIEYLRDRYNQSKVERSITVYNASSSVIIDSIDISQNAFRATTNGNTIGGGDSYNVYLQSPERNFEIKIKYHYIGSSVQLTKTNKIAVMGDEYIVFYKQLGDNFNINKTTDMNLLLTSADKNDFIVNNDINSVKFNILNESSAMRVVGLAIRKYRAATTDLMYYKDDSGFISHGPIGAAGGNDSVIFSKYESIIESGESYTIQIIGEDYRDAVGKGMVVIELQRPLYMGGAVTLTVTETMVQNAKQHNVPKISYQVTANGGTGDPHNAAYDTTGLTFTFDSAPSAIPTFDYIGGVTVGQLTKTSNPLVYTATCTAVADATIQVICGNTQTSNVTADVHYVQVFKSQPGVPDVITTRYIFKEAYVENPVVQRNTDHQLRWVLKYDTVIYTNGVETSRQTTTKTQLGEWLIDSSINSGYISFNKTGLLKIGPRPSGAVAYHANDKVGVAEWDFYASVEFGQTVDGHLVENMPYQSVPLFLGPIQIGSKKVYGLQVTLKIKN